MAEQQQSGFFIEHDADDADQRLSRPHWVALPTTAAELTRAANQTPRFTLHNSSQNDGNPKVLAAGEQRTGVVLEVIQHEHQSYVLMTAPADAEVRVNGLRAGRVEVLTTKDQLHIQGCGVLHISVCHSPDCGPARGSELGAECLVCRTPIADKQTVFRCTFCNAAMHAGGPGRPEHDRLECAAATRECPRCRNHLIREEGFEYVPDL